MAEFDPPVNGVEVRLDAILAELRAQRAERRPPEPPAGTVELREPAPATPRRR